jgi:hypothetical protein
MCQSKFRLEEEKITRTAFLKTRLHERKCFPENPENDQIPKEKC